MQEYVIVYCEAHGSDILLVMKNRPAKMAGRLNLPGGKIDPTDDGPIDAAIRELKEESGLDGTNPEYFGRLLVEKDAADKQAVIHCIKAKVDGFQPFQPRSEETEVVQWHEWKSVITDPRLMPNLRLIIPLIRAGVTGWEIDDSFPSWGKARHGVSIEVPTYH